MWYSNAFNDNLYKLGIETRFFSPPKTRMRFPTRFSSMLEAEQTTSVRSICLARANSQLSASGSGAHDLLRRKKASQLRKSCHNSENFRGISTFKTFQQVSICRATDTNRQTKRQHHGIIAGIRNFLGSCSARNHGFRKTETAVPEASCERLARQRM